MPRRGSIETNLQIQAMVDARDIAKIVEYYNERGEHAKLRNMSTLIRAIISEYAQLCGGDEIKLLEVAIDILEGEKLLPQRAATIARLTQAEVHQARLEQRADGYTPTKMESKKDKQSMFDELALAAVKKFRAEQAQKANDTNKPKETFTERMKRLKDEADAQRITTNEDYEIGHQRS